MRTEEKVMSVETCTVTDATAGEMSSTPRVQRVAPEFEASPAATPRNEKAASAGTEAMEIKPASARKRVVALTLPERFDLVIWCPQTWLVRRRLRFCEPVSCASAGSCRPNQEQRKRAKSRRSRLREPPRRSHSCRPAGRKH